MSRGNQRDKDRERAQKKAAANNKGPKQSAQRLSNKREADAQALAAKVAAKQAKATVTSS
ncbi:hypothetical protein WALSEDRAFT_69469 [Wallemia mellicola CBS 633.66]|uniref:Small EDRK-rich factor-like N-terminal domain-containing protein n=1 Tax=Wallemia mellicola (strain ATCC MYA-4683 / CBS 633.66) TaxID=671144 RepID=I4YAQ7_WALMC|nr:hypothetical protein WALSEDRAFT_69469 [Wallemia mellicola CBS 633.66]EIM21049.1 hypothetical protein WALSEDRAFT_69469 [Wallemia mellicola CBS 633.66]|eukprot:XP_006959035.1 hypothetical protein WALSEDRAFT_69469 [Wallemia mellicola CBS 633.66]